MTIQELITVVENKYNTLAARRAAALAQGDLVTIESLTAEIAETSETLATLRGI